MLEHKQQNLLPSQPSDSAHVHAKLCIREDQVEPSFENQALYDCRSVHTLAQLKPQTALSAGSGHRAGVTPHGTLIPVQMKASDGAKQLPDASVRVRARAKGTRLENLYPISVGWGWSSWCNLEQLSSCSKLRVGEQSAVQLPQKLREYREGAQANSLACSVCSGPSPMILTILCFSPSLFLFIFIPFFKLLVSCIM